jgi:hypothetical protein
VARAQTLFGKDAAAQFTQRARKTTHERDPPQTKLSTIIRAAAR